MCKRSCMEPSCAQQPDDERVAAGSDAALKRQDERAGCAGTSGQPASSEVEKKKSRAADEKDGAGELVVRRSTAAAGEDSARERLKRHRTEMAGRVRIPEMWGQERLLKDWVVDCAVFDRPLAATRGLLTARDALVAECAAPRRPPHGHGSTARPLRVQNGCS